jgi:hypothetical protein
VPALARTDLECDSVSVFLVGAPQKVSVVVETGRRHCGDYVLSRYRAEGCERARYYACKK